MQQLKLSYGVPCPDNGNFDICDTIALAATLDDCCDRDPSPGDMIWAQITGRCNCYIFASFLSLLCKICIDIWGISTKACTSPAFCFLYILLTGDDVACEFVNSSGKVYCSSVNNVNLLN